MTVPSASTRNTAVARFEANARARIRTRLRCAGRSLAASSLIPPEPSTPSGLDALALRVVQRRQGGLGREPRPRDIELERPLVDGLGRDPVLVLDHAEPDRAAQGVPVRPDPVVADPLSGPQDRLAPPQERGGGAARDTDSAARP